MRLPNLAHPLLARSGTSDLATFDEIFLSGEYDLPFENFAPLRILDLGANVGYAAVRFASLWPEAEILCVEPAPGNMDLLRRNTRAWKRVTLLWAAVWSHATALRIVNPKDAANAYRMGEAIATGADSVPSYTVAQLIDRLGWPRVDLLKMDVEGAEAEILRAGADWLGRVGVLVVELHDRTVPGCAESLFQALANRRFRQEIVGRSLAIQFL